MTFRYTILTFRYTVSDISILWHFDKIFLTFRYFWVVSKCHCIEMQLYRNVIVSKCQPARAPHCILYTSANNRFPKGFIFNSLPGKVNHDSRCKWRLLEIYSSNVIRVYKSHVVQGTILGKFHIHEVMGFVQRMLLRH